VTLILCDAALAGGIVGDRRSIPARALERLAQRMSHRPLSFENEGLWRGTWAWLKTPGRELNLAALAALVVDRHLKAAY
jgi:hypothetical protein